MHTLTTKVSSHHDEYFMTGCPGWWFNCLGRQWQDQHLLPHQQNCHPHWVKQPLLRTQGCLQQFWNRHIIPLHGLPNVKSHKKPNIVVRIFYLDQKQTLLSCCAVWRARLTLLLFIMLPRLLLHVMMKTILICTRIPLTTLQLARNMQTSYGKKSWPRLCMISTQQSWKHSNWSTSRLDNNL